MINYIKRIRFLESQKNLLNEDGLNMLKIFKDKECIFFHIPKAAGISISRSLFGDVGWGHHDYFYYRYIFGKKSFNKFFKFSFVRNPYNRLYSAFHFLKNGGISPQDYRFSKEKLDRFSSFSDFVLNGMEDKEILNFVHFKPQTDFIIDEKGNNVVDFLGKFERIDKDFKEVCDILGVEVPLKFLNKTPKKNKKPLNLSSVHKNIISKVYSRDFKIFEYEP